MNLTPNDLKKGVIFSLDGEIYESLEYRQKVMARQQAVVSVKARNLRTNKLWQRTFQGSENIETADLLKRTVQFLYGDEKGFHFMDMDSYRQYLLSAQTVADKADYLAEGQNFILYLSENRPLTLELPKTVWLEVKFAPEVVKGDTSSALTKEAELATGLKLKVPAFIKSGDVISVNTANGTYRERQK